MNKEKLKYINQLLEKIIETKGTISIIVNIANTCELSLYDKTTNGVITITNQDIPISPLIKQLKNDYLAKLKADLKVLQKEFREL